MQDSSELRDTIIKRINKNGGKYSAEFNNILDDLEGHLRLVDETFWYDDHGHPEFSQVYSVALNDETRDVKFLRVYVAVASDIMYADEVKPVTKVVTKYEKE